MRWRGRCGLLVALVLVMASVAASAGSQTFVNDTGETATGIVITFSTQALITWNDGKLPAQTPDGMSDTFTFSGGSVEPGAGCMISWGPGSASVVDYQWLTKEETSATPPENSPAVDNNLPGPDEPLYQPQPGEQVWLTDAEEHAVIYDNDSIKLNFAPGFDQSQIERIVWYRNGIRMRFVNPEDKVQLLTNALMKTFDGNPLEHSPASAHTDHAIAGYDYKVEVDLKDGGLKILQTTVESTFKWHPEEVWAELEPNSTFLLNNEPDASYHNTVLYFKTLKDDGFTGISFDIPFYMDTPYGNVIHELKSADNSIIRASTVTPSIRDLETILKAINESGLEAHVRGEIFISNKYSKQHGFSWSSMIDPNDPEIFFKNYTDLWMGIIPILNKYHVELISPFTEMDGIEKYSNLIKNMFDQIARVFTGKLGFEEATNLMLAGISPVQKGRTFEQMEKYFTFWDWKDSRGRPMIIEYSGWISGPVETQKDQRVSMIERMFKQYWSRGTSYYGSKYPNNPQMFGEIGAKNFDGYVLHYSDPSNQFAPDEQERADFMYAALKTSKELRIDLINLWTFNLGECYPNWKGGDLITTGFRHPLVPEYRVIRAIIGSN